MLSRHPKKRYRRSRRRNILSLTIVIVLPVLVISVATISLERRSHSHAQSILPQIPPNPTISVTQRFPHVAPHPLPDSLANWVPPELTNDGDNSELADNYFEHIHPTRFGHLVWSRFPVTVYLDVDPSPLTQLNSLEPSLPFLREQQQQWKEAVQSAILEWDQYIPLVQVFEPNNADITIVALTPPLQWSHLFGRTPEIHTAEKNYAQQNWITSSSTTPPLIARARTAETTYHLYLDHLDPSSSQYPVLRQRYQIFLSPRQTASYLLATARHELGHAMGIWGHSPFSTDALYFSQVRTPQRISVRDINTLKKLYQQPTQIGWSLPDPTSS